MIPWAVYEVFMGEYKVAAALLIIYVVTQAVRQLIQPKLVGDSVGLNPLVTLLLLYIGYRVGRSDLDDPCSAGRNGNH